MRCVAIALLVGAGGCSTSDATGSDAGSGGTTGSGGAAGMGGTPGSGGTTGSGGAAGTGGAPGSGGAGLDAATDRGTGPSADAGAAPTFTEIFNTILKSEQSCANGYCHGAGIGGVYLTSKERGYATLVPAKVIASNPNGSILIQRLTTTNTDQRMPKGGSPLSAAEIEKVRAWILAGAPNN